MVLVVETSIMDSTVEFTETNYQLQFQIKYRITDPQVYAHCVDKMRHMKTLLRPESQWDHWKMFITTLYQRLTDPVQLGHHFEKKNTEYVYQFIELGQYLEYQSNLGLGLCEKIDIVTDTKTDVQIDLYIILQGHWLDNYERLKDKLYAICDESLRLDSLEFFNVAVSSGFPVHQFILQHTELLKTWHQEIQSSVDWNWLWDFAKIKDRYVDAILPLCRLQNKYQLPHKLHVECPIVALQVSGRII